MGILLLVAARNLRQAGRRTLVLGLAVSLVTALLVILLALSQGLTDTLIRTSTTLGTGHVNVAGFYKVRSGDAAPMVTNATAVRKIVEASTPGLDYVIDRQRGWAKVVVENGTSMQCGLVGVDLAGEPKLLGELQLAPEKDYRVGGGEATHGDLRRLSEPGSAVIFASQAKRLDVGVGDALTITTQTFRGSTNTVEVTVVAVAKDVGLMSTFNVFVHKKTILEAYRLKEDTTGAVMVYLKDIDRAEDVMGVLREKLAASGYRLMDHVPQPFWMKFEPVSGEDWTGQKLDLTVWKDEVSFLNWIITAFDTISFFLVGILLVIIGVGIMNAMWIAVRERTREIGTLRAIGMSRPRILAMFLFEAMLLGLVATSAGAAAGTAIAYALEAAEIRVPIAAFRLILMGDTLHLSVQAGRVAGAALVLTLVTGLSALLPAHRASKVQPVTAIHHVG